MTAAMTGLREGELLSLRWRDVDFAAETIRVQQDYSQHLPRGEVGTPKSNKGRSVPLMPNIAAALDDLTRHSP